MAEDPKISRRYRELSREEPPRHLDEAILVAARRAAETRPAPLVVPSGRLRWYFPLAAAAIIVLAVAVTVHVEREQPDPEAVVSSAPVEQVAPARAPAEPPRTFTPDPKPAPTRDQAAAAPADSRELRALREAEPPADLQKAQKAPASSAIPPAAAPAQPPAHDAVGGIREAPQPRAALRSRAEATTGAVSGFATASPEQWLQGIADLKRQGRDDEAEKQLAEFRKRYPDYRIPEAITEKFEKR